jgi:hypothetical protein
MLDEVTLATEIEELPFAEDVDIDSAADVVVC